jgi:hypothetical protein
VPLAAGFEGPAAEMGLLPVCVCIPYVYACWQKRCEILHPEHTASGPPTQREVDGLAAMA